MKNQPKKKKKVCRYGIKIYCISYWSLNHNDSVKLHGSGLFVKTTKYLYMQSKITNYYTCIKKKVNTVIIDILSLVHSILPYLKWVGGKCTLNNNTTKENANS